jgi:hypothetical protein
VTLDKEQQVKEVDKGVFVYEGAAPETGTVLTLERISRHLDSLNSGYAYGARIGEPRVSGVEREEKLQPRRDIRDIEEV